MNESDDVTKFKYEAWTEEARARSYAKANGDQSVGHLQIETYLRWLLEEHRPGTTRVLDAGCGTGALTTALSRVGFDVTGVDVSQAMLNQIARSRRVTKQVGDVFSPRLGLPSSVQDFDVAVSRWVLPHFPEWPSIIQNIAGTLKMGGSIYLDFPNPDHYQLAQEVVGNSEQVHGYSFDQGAEPNSFYRAPSRDEVEAAALAAGCELIAVRPASFLSTNALAREPSQLAMSIGTLLKSRRARRSLVDLDQSLAKMFPAELCGMLIYRLVRRIP